MLLQFIITQQLFGVAFFDINGGIKPPSALNLTDLSVSDFNLWCEAFNDFFLLTQEKKDDDFLRSLFLAIGGLELRKLVHG